MLSFPYLEVIETLRLTACPTCGQTYAVPAALFIAARRDQTPLHCPTGHTWTPLAQDVDTASNPDQRRIEALAALADARVQLQAAQGRLVELRPADPTPPNAKEMRRRCRVMAERADGVAGARHEASRAICPCCGRPMSRNHLRTHLRRRHSEELAKKPVSYFDAAADRILSRFA